MKTLYKNSVYFALSLLCCLFLAMPVSAQRTSNGGSSSGNSGGGGSRSSGGSGGGAPARSSGGSSNYSARPSSGGANYSRPSGGGSYQRPAGAVRGPVYVDRQGNVIRNNVGVQRSGAVVAQRGTNYASGSAGTGVRGPVSGGVTGYRTAPQIGYGRGPVGYWGNHGYYYNNHGYYSSYYLPRLGFTCGVLPYGYYPFYFGDYQYFYSDGLYYQYENDQYTVVEPPIGAQITTLPANAQSIMINGQQYYELNGVYYQPVTKDDGSVVYMIAGKDGVLNTTQDDQQQQQGPQIGDIVTQLPPDCRKIKVNGNKLYVSPDGVYYQEQVDQSGATTYKIVGLPSDEPDAN
ncbi:hypothetical protein JN11_02689 [Mucilaginibacter frigoritolerans]|uniref:Uncharacterized protein n=1 Tax=Mucilaginibacter frigoritolerans TaxID=652788 RepID=A0A562U0I6_9SPHI|nr:DUF6515 family protein [Mucilaginibacter frigoritolerans]TWI99372.1 hypothetical protein JN11_02689 [Mucilaginibacter frigoritolerans]